MKIEKLLIIGLTIIFTISSCTKDFDEINKDPNRVTVASNSSLLVYAQREAAYHFLSGGSTLQQWSQYTADINSSNAFLSFDPGGEYSNLYHDILYQLEQIIVTSDIETNIKNRDYYAIAKVMQLWTMATSVELWGDMPYFDALRGGTIEGGTEERYIKPKFDSQEEIYKDIIQKLDEMNTFISESKKLSGILNVGSYDIYANGNMTVWQKFVNAYQCKLYLNLSVADRQFAFAGLEKIFSNPELYPVFASEKEFLGIKWQGFGGLSANISGIAYSLYNNGDYLGNAGVVSTGIIRIMAESKDPRRFSFFKRPKTLYKSVFKPVGADSIKVGNKVYYKDAINVLSGFPPARTETTPANILRPSINYYTSIGGGFANIDRVDFVMDYSELCFIMAEAKLMGINALPESVDNYYQNGIRASLGYHKSVYSSAIEDELLYAKTTFEIKAESAFAEDSIQKFLNQPNVKLTGDVKSDFEKIIAQRYVANFNNGYTAFSIIRRTGLPELDYFAIGTNADLGFPTRYEYPESVAVTNGDNLIKAIGKLSNNIFDGKVWLFNNCPDVQPASDKPLEDYLLYDVFTCEQIYPPK